MKKVIWICLAMLCVLTLTACHAPAPESLPSEGTAPNFTVWDAAGNEVRLSDLYGKPVVINFWATWCGYCKQEMPDFDRACKEYPDVVFLMINATDGVYETKEKADAYVEREGFSFDVYYDLVGSAQAAYKLTGYPTTVFIDANGDAVRREDGMISYETLTDGIDMIVE